MNQALQLEVTTPSDREIVMKRTFHAPRRLVFDAMTKPDLMKRWFFGPDGWSLAVCEIDLQVGGSYKFVWRGEDGAEFGSQGECKELRAPELYVATERFMDYPGESIVTMAWEEDNDKTHFTMTMLYESKEIRDMALQSGMEQGVAAGYDRLEGLLPGIAEEQRA